MASELTMPEPFEDLSASPPPPSHHRKKQWPELRQAVRKTRKLATNLLNRVPHSFTFRHLQTSEGCKTRIYYLGVPPMSREHTLQYIDVPSECVAGETMDWKMLMLDSFQATPVHSQFSKEEQLLRERKRLGSFGITAYDYNEDIGRFVFPACSSLFHCTDAINDDHFGKQQILPTEVKSSCAGTRLDPKLCPFNPSLLAFISNSDVWVTNLATGSEQRLTYTHNGSKNLVDDPLSAGVPSFVVQEEFDRYTGYWWQPTSHSEQGEMQVYRILYEVVDESEVEILHIVSATHEEGGVDDYRYPRAGTPNAICNLRMLEFHVDNTGAICDVEEKQLHDSLSTLFPWMEYIPRAGWTPDGKFVYVELLDRQQKRLQLVLIPLQCFCLSNNDDAEMTSFESTVSSPIQVIYQDTSDIWVNAHDILHFFPRENEHEISFIWSSEKSGYRHLYLVTSQISALTSTGQQSALDLMERHIDSMKANVISEVALTQGDWEVSGKQIWVDAKRKLVYFIGLKDTPLETHLYVVSYENPGSVVRLTELGFSHAIAIDKQCSMFVSVYSSISQTPASQLYYLIHSEDGSVLPKPSGKLLQSAAMPEDYHVPELFNYQSEYGSTVYGMLYKPHDYEPGKRYPTMLFVYGGPQVQLVTNAHKGVRFLRLHTLASLGYAVVVLDTRGSSHRGLKFESHIQSKLGTVEIADQVEGLQWLASQVDFIDLARVGIHGWSYGGFLSLMGLCQRPDVFKVSVAGAPVTSWNLYDTGYTERYMDTPQNNAQAYKAGSVLEQVENFPSEGSRLLIVHGLIDENVHFAHTSVLINALIKACKPYQLQVYPNERHGIRNPDASEHYETMVLNFLQDNL